MEASVHLLEVASGGCYRKSGNVVASDHATRYHECDDKQIIR